MQFEDLSDSIKKSIENYRNKNSDYKNTIPASKLYICLICDNPHISDNEINFVLKLAKTKNYWRK